MKHHTFLFSITHRVWSKNFKFLILFNFQGPIGSGEEEENGGDSYFEYLFDANDYRLFIRNYTVAILASWHHSWPLGTINIKQTAQMEFIDKNVLKAAGTRILKIVYLCLTTTSFFHQQNCYHSYSGNTPNSETYYKVLK